MKEPTQSISVMVPIAMRDKIAKAAEKERRSISKQIVYLLDRAIEEYLDNQEKANS